MSEIDPLSLDYLALVPNLTLALEEVRHSLQKFAAFEFLAKMRLAFGRNFKAEMVNDLARSWREGDFSIISTIEFLSASELNGANGA